jgi:hypothetical protein
MDQDTCTESGNPNFEIAQDITNVKQSGYKGWSQIDKSVFPY